MKQVNEFRIIPGDVIEFTNSHNYKFRNVVKKITDKSIIYATGQRESWNTINSCLKEFAGTINGQPARRA